MSELTWLEAYSGQSTEELIALEGQYRVDSLVAAFEQAIDQKAERVGKEGLTDEERAVLAVEALEREVNNGGYDQFFLNPSAEYASVVVDTLRRIGCEETAELTRRAIGVLGIEESVTLEAIERVMEEEDDNRDDQLEECDSQYYEVAGDLAEPLFEFIKKNRDRIHLK